MSNRPEERAIDDKQYGYRLLQRTGNKLAQGEQHETQLDVIGIIGGDQTIMDPDQHLEFISSGSV